ncbi:MAG TPA: helix-turn-helix transcriptional regulator, partial [Chitinophagaceae bacterium]|nr:helix-turn-helix transcriptional regulator [Chitinophagaceae bacterium]
MANINKNIRYMRRLRGWTQAQMAAKLGIKRSLLGAYEENRATPKTEVLEKLSDTFYISIDDLLRSDISKKGGNYQDYRRKIKDQPRQVIEFVPMKATAGYLSGYEDLEFLEELNTFTLPMLGSGHFRAFEISGDSMLPVTSGSV